MNTWGLVVLLVALAAATAFGVYRARTDGRVLNAPSVPAFTPTSAPATPAQTRENDSFITLDGDNSSVSALRDADLGTRATLVQFSTAFCQPCRATRKILDDVRDLVAGVTVIHIDAEDNLELVRQLDVRRTPTVFVLNQQGAVVKRAVGQPRKADVIAAIGELA